MLLDTPDFMAPEQMHDPGAVDRRADLFGLRCLAHSPRLSSLPDPWRDFWLECRPGDSTPQKRLNVQAEQIRDPLLQLELFVREKLSEHFPLVGVASFANSGPRGDSR